MALTPEEDRVLTRRARGLSAIIVATAVLWLGGQWLGGRLGLEVRYVFLLDLAAAAAFVWTLAVGIGIWRKRRG